MHDLWRFQTLLLSIAETGQADHLQLTLPRINIFNLPSYFWPIVASSLIQTKRQVSAFYESIRMIDNPAQQE